MNILEIEDMIKGLPDQALQREAQMPSGQVPQFLVVSEIQRRGDMRKRFSERQPQGTVKDQVIQEGIAAMAPPEPQMQSAMMGMQQPMPQAMPSQMQMQQPQMAPPMQMAEGRATPFPDDPRLAELRAQGLTDEQIAQEIRRLGLNEDRMAQLGLPTIGTMEATIQPDAYSQDAYADIFARQQGNIPAGMEFVDPRTTSDLLSPQVGFTTREMAQAQTLPNVPVERPAPSQRGIGSAPEGTADALQAQIQALRSTPASPVAQADFAMPDFAMPDFASYRQTINAALAPPPATGSRSVGNLLGSDMPAPSSVDGSAPVSAPPAVDNSALAAQLVAESQARRNQEPSPAIGTFDTPAPENNALIQELIAGSEARRGREPSAAVGTFDAPAPQDTALIEQLIAGSEARRGREASPAVGDFTQPEKELTDRQIAMQQMIGRIEKRKADAPIIPDFLTQDTKPMLQARERYSDSPVQKMITQANQPQQTPFSPESYERMIASLEGTGLDSALASPLPTQTIDIVKLAEQSLRQQGLSGPQAQDVSRFDEDDAEQETQELAGAGDSTASLSGTPQQVVTGVNTAGSKDTPTEGAGGGAKQGTGASAEGQGLRSVTKTLTDDFLDSMIGDESIAGKVEAKASSLAKAIRNRERPTLDYSTLIAEYEAQMQPEIDALKKERGSQALLALGAGIAKGDLSAGLSGAAKAAAASNAERRALKAKQQAAQMGLKKSQMDAAYQNALEQSGDEIKAIAAEVEALKDYGIATRQAESMAFSKAAEAEKVIAKMAADRDLQAARAAQDSEREQGLLRRAAIDAAKEFIRRLPEVTVRELGTEGIKREFNRAIAEYASALGATLQSDLTASSQSGESTGDMSIGGYRVREST